MCIPFILSGIPNKCWLHTCDACIITTWRLGLRAPLVTRNNNNNNNKNNNNNRLQDVTYTGNWLPVEHREYTST